MDKKKLYPITSLRRLDTNTQGKLAHANIILVNTILKTDIRKLNKRTGISLRILNELKQEAEKIIQ